MSITFSGATTKPIRRVLRARELVRGTAYQVRVSNLVADITSSRYADDLYLTEIAQVKYDDFTYPRSVLAGLSARATDQISGSLKFSTVADQALVRVWDGATWTVEFSRNPAWVCYDILTQPVLDNALAVQRYDGFDPSRLVLADFYAWAQYCDTLVPDGAGGTEPRCLFDGVFDAVMPMWDSALEVAASARAQLVPRGVRIGVAVDTVRALPSQIFTVGNTEVKSFRETFVPLLDRASTIEIEFTNADKDYVRDKLAVVSAGMTDTASTRVQIALRGVTRPSQIWREAMIRLKRNELITRTGDLGASIDSLNCTIGDLVWVQSDITRWGEGGRCVAGGTLTTVPLDKAVTLSPGLTYELRLRLADDTLLTRTVTTAAGTVSSVDVSPDLPSAPDEFDLWALGETGAAVKEFLITDIVRDGEQDARLSLVEYNASLYGIDDEEPAIPTDNVSAVVTPSLTDYTIEEVMELAADGVVQVHLDLRFDLVDGRSVVISERQPDGSFVALGQSFNGWYRRANVTSGVSYTLRATPTDYLGTAVPSAALTLTHAVVGKLAPPADVTGFGFDGRSLSWTEVADLDLWGYLVRFHYGANTEWGSAMPLHSDAIAGSPWLLDPRPPGTVTLLIKAVDDSGNESTNASYLMLELGDPVVANVVESIDYRALVWPGSVSGASEIGGDLVASQSDPFYKADASNFYGPDGGLFYDPNYDALEWISSGWTPSLAATGSLMTAEWALTGFARAVQYRPTAPGAFYGADLESFYGPDADPFYDPSPAWLPWPGSVSASNIEYQWRVTTAVGPTPGLLSAFTVSVDVPDRTQRLNGIAIAPGGTRLTGAIGQFNAISNIQLTLRSGSTAVKLEIVDYSATLGPLITALDGSGTGVAATIDAYLQGY